MFLIKDDTLDAHYDIAEIYFELSKARKSNTEYPKLIQYHLEKAYHICAEGRPGPVWLDIPANIQNASSVPTITNLNQVFFFANYDFPTFLADSIHFSMVSSKSLYECACETNIVSN